MLCVRVRASVSVSGSVLSVPVSVPVSVSVSVLSVSVSVSVCVSLAEGEVSELRGQQREVAGAAVVLVDVGLGREGVAECREAAAERRQEDGQHPEV